MQTQTDIWQFFAGLGFFLYGMHHIDAVIRNMQGRSVKVFLKKSMDTRLGAVFSGLLVTAVLQSSSIVNLLLLSFSGAGMMSLRNSLAVVLGSNIGGTVNSWLVALLGFKVDLGSFALAFVALSGIALFLLRESSRWHRVFLFCMGFGLVLLGFDFAKMSMEGFVNSINLHSYANYPGIVYLLVGFVITALVQTSAATVMIVLSALYAEAIPLEMGVSIVLGAELGTTIKIVLGSISGAAIKRRIAAANLALNITSTAIGFFFLSQILFFIQFAGLNDKLLLLVAFQTVVNIIGALIFFFFLDPLTTILSKFFKDDSRHSTRFLQRASADLPRPALELLEKEVRFFLLRVMAFNMRCFSIDAGYLARKYLHDELQQPHNEKPDVTHYEDLKSGEDEIIAFNAELHKTTVNTNDSIRLNQLMVTVRHGMYSAKALKDIEHNIRTLGDSVLDHDYNMYKHFREEMQVFMEKWLRVWDASSTTEPAGQLSELLNVIEKDHHEDAKTIYGHMGKIGYKSTLLNVNREMYNASKSMILALRELLNVNDPPQLASATSIK